MATSRDCALAMTLLLVTATLASGAPARAADPATNDLAARLTDLDDGVVRLAYPARDQVERRRWFRGKEDSLEPVIYGREDERQALVELEIRDGRVVDLELWLAQRWRRPCKDCLNLGQVDPSAAADWFLSLVRREPPGRSQRVLRRSTDVAEEALTAAVVARGADLAEPLLDLARSHSYDDDLRGSAVLWLALLAVEHAVGPLEELTRAEQETADMREVAVIALAQLPDDQGVPLLMDMARDHPFPEVQTMALLMLGQHSTDEVVDLLADILLD